MEEQFFSIFGKYAGVAILAVCGSFVFFRFLGRKWIDSKFSSALEKFKHEQQMEIELLKFKINGLLDRTTKIQQKEFEVLPEIWSKLVEARACVLSFISPIQTYTNIEKIAEDELPTFLDEVEFNAFEKMKVINSRPQERSNIFQELIREKRFYKNREKLRLFTEYYRKNSILLPLETQSKFNDIEKMLWDAWEEHNLNIMASDYRTRTKYDILKSDGEKSFKEIESLIHSRLWNTKLDA